MSFIGPIVMARRKKGRDLNGWLLVDKPSGMTSSDVVNKLRWLYDANKAGHGGTLDPDATGLLPVAFGEATKFLPFLDEAEKTYTFRVNWGAQTSSDDAGGVVIATSDDRPTLHEIENALTAFRGHIMQTPPQVSAVKVDGARAYDLAREGVHMDLKSRPLFVASLEIEGHDRDHLDLKMRCGKGGYVRSIARDLGHVLRCYGHVAYLRRLGCLGFDISQALPFAAILARNGVSELIAVEDTPIIQHWEITQSEVAELGFGRELERNDVARLGEIALAMCSGHPIAIVEFQKDGIVVKRGLHVKEVLPL